MEFLQTLSALSHISIEKITLIAAVFTRISALVFFLPGLGERTIPVRVRLTAAMAITFILIPIIMATAPAQPSTISGAAVMFAAEAISGALIGFSIRIAIFAIQTAGAVIGQSLSLSQLFGSNISFEPESPVSTLFMITGVVLAVSTGLHIKAISVLIVSYDVMPLGLFPGASATGQWAADRAGFAFATAISLALPFIILGFVYNLAIGAANRAMPQLMVAFVGVPAVTLAGLVLLALSAPVLLDAWMNVVDDILQTLMDQMS